ncbi:MAG: 30S ribosomal protein S2, partial [Gammaproteobacteria bacterium]|nr:30S ribosomal protein S2 [Gammaproteobacteria bacterium]
IRRLKDLEAQAADGTFDRLTKKETIVLRREMQKLERGLGGIKEMASLPDALFIIDVGFENIAVKEARKLGIPIVAVVDTNNSPDEVDYVIPGNDDAIRAIRLYAKGMADAIIDGRQAVPVAPKDSNDEFVELDEEGKPAVKAEPKKKAPAKKTAKKAPAKKAAAKSDDDKPEEKAEAKADEKAEEAPKKKAAAKKTTKKAAAKKTAKKATTKKSTAKKSTAKKSTAKKKTAAKKDESAE